VSRHQWSQCFDTNALPVMWATEGASNPACNDCFNSCQRFASGQVLGDAA